MSITVDTLKALVPKAQRSMINDSLVEKINASCVDSTISDAIKDNFISYLNVLADGKYKIEDYLNAVKFVSYKLMDMSDIDAYIATFPDRYQRLVNEGGSTFKKDDASPYVAMYKKNKLVVSIFEQTIIPSHVLNAPLFQQALNELSKIMLSSRSDMARVKAAEAILNNTKVPETKNFKLDVGINQIDAISNLRDAVEKLGEAQKLAIINGTNLKAIAESNIIEAEVLND